MSVSILVVGLGNPLAADDGAGVAVVEELARRGLPAHARVEILGSDSLRLPTLWRGEPRVWLVDALVTGAAPGSVHRLEHESVMALHQRHASAHALSLPENLRWIALSEPRMTAVRYTLWGIEPLSLGCGRLSDEVAFAVGPAAAQILTALGATDPGHLTKSARHEPATT